MANKKSTEKEVELVKISKLIKDIYWKIRWFEQGIKEANKRGEYYADIELDKQKIKVLNIFLTELHKLDGKGQKTISKKKADKMIHDIVYKKLHMLKTPFKEG